METPRLVGVGVQADRGKYGAQMRKGQVRGKLGRDIMALCIMSKCGEERCGDRFFRTRKVGTEHYGIMHNVEEWGKWVGGMCVWRVFGERE